METSGEEGYSYTAPRVLANAESSTGVIQNKKFDAYRRRATKWGKCIMYIGYFLMITNGLGLFTNFGKLYMIFFTERPDVKHGPEDRDPRRPFTAWEMSVGVFMDNFSKLLHISIGYILVKATKIPIRQMSSQKFDSSTEIIKMSGDVKKF